MAPSAPATRGLRSMANAMMRGRSKTLADGGVDPPFWGRAAPGAVRFMASIAVGSSRPVHNNLDLVMSCLQFKPLMRTDEHKNRNVEASVGLTELLVPHG